MSADTLDKPLAPDTHVGPYTVSTLLGEGGMGHVYEATAADGGRVALKVVRASLAGDESFLRRFQREARAAALVDSRHVVSVLDVGVDQERHYMALELVTGGSLQDRLDRDGPLELDAVARVTAQVASALDALHRVELVHRDVKPANVMLDPDGNARLTDFGLAKQRDASVLTKMGQTVGSMDYMAPEQIRGEGEITGVADVYALGCVVYECIAGRTPFADREGMRILWAHLQETAEDPSLHRPDCPSSLGWAVAQALNKEPGDRPPSATAFARMVQMAVGSGGGSP